MALQSVRIPALDALPGLEHGFEQRAADSARETREESRRRVGSELASFGRLHLLRQVHGAQVVAAPFEGHPEADAATAAGAGVLLGIETADCLPVLLVDPVRQFVASAHAGWRGTAAQVAPAAVRALVALGSAPGDLLAALGPCIGACCYEVGDELRARFGPSGGAWFRPGPKGRPHLDVRAANVQQLIDAGVRPEQVHHVRACTSCAADRYHSYRRDGPGSGRMISFVGFAR